MSRDGLTRCLPSCAGQSPVLADLFGKHLLVEAFGARRTPTTSLAASAPASCATRRSSTTSPVNSTSTSPDNAARSTCRSTGVSHTGIAAKSSMCSHHHLREHRQLRRRRQDDRPIERCSRRRHGVRHQPDAHRRPVPPSDPRRRRHRWLPRRHRGQSHSAHPRTRRLRTKTQRCGSEILERKFVDLPEDDRPAPDRSRH